MERGITYRMEKLIGITQTWYIIMELGTMCAMERLTGTILEMLNMMADGIGL